MAMTDEEIRAFNESYYRRETVEFELEPEGVTMTDKDIVEKLKDRRSIDGPVSYVEMSEIVLDEAIYEIEKLRRKIEAISQVAGKASIEGVTFAQIKVRDSDVLGKYTGPLIDSMSQTAEALHAKALNDGK